MNVTTDFRGSVEAELTQGSVLHLWIRSTSPEAAAEVWGEGEAGRQLLALTHSPDFTFFEIAANGPLFLSWDDRRTEVSCLYAFNPATVARVGIQVLHVTAQAAPPDLPGTYHLRPPFGWMNDPNGFCRVGDTWHLFYQHYPHAARWSSMHWGHAVSQDLVTWVHQPVFLRPDPEVALRHEGLGGIFSGSALPLPDGSGLRVFFTDSLLGRQPAPEFQRSALSHDSIRVTDDKVIIPGPPEGLGLTGDFRDPYVFAGPDGHLRMILGSRDAAGGVLLLYRTPDPTGASDWTFQSVLHRDDRLGMTVVECPCLVPLDGPPTEASRWALIYAQLESTDPATGRRNLGAAIVGRFDGEAFTPEFERELDFGTSAYAYQAIATAAGPVGIAWLANWKDWDRVSDFPTAMTLPTRLRLSANGDELLVEPAEELMALRRGELALAEEWVALPHGTAEIAIALAEASGPVRLEVATTSRTLAVEVNAEGLEIVTGMASARLVAFGATPRHLRVFLDAGSIEVFADGGRWNGTHRLSDMDGIVAIRLLAEPGRILEAHAWDLALPSTPATERTVP